MTVQGVTVTATTNALGLLAVGIGRSEDQLAVDAGRVVANPSDAGALVDMRVAHLGFDAVAAAFGSVADTERSVIELLA